MTRRGRWHDRMQRMAATARTVHPRGEAPRWVWLWQRLDPRQVSPEGDALLARLALLFSVPIMLAHGVAALVYGHSAMLTPAGFIDMPGACAWLTATGSFALALAAMDGLVGGGRVPRHSPARSVTTTHTIWLAPGRPLRQVEVKTALPPMPPSSSGRQRLRAGCLIAAGIACASALVGRALLALGLDAFARPVIAFAPRAEWPLWPLQVTWPWLLQFARDDFVLGSIGIGVALFFFSQVLAWRKVRGAWLPLAVVAPILVALGHIGSAAYDFAAARGLGGFRDADLVAALASDPGRHNLYTFISLWVAIGCASSGLCLGYLLGRSESLGDD